MAVKLNSIPEKDALPLLKKLILDKVHFCASAGVDRIMFQEMDVEVVVERLSGCLMALMTTMLLGKKQPEERREVCVERVPVSWWDHLKAEKFPLWLRKRYPPKTREIKTEVFVQRTHVCPHVPPFNLKNCKHIAYLTGHALGDDYVTWTEADDERIARTEDS